MYFTVPWLNNPGQHFLAWTTAPWTVPANTALAVHPDMIYSLVRLVDKAVWVGQEFKERVYPDLPPMDAHPGIDFVGAKYEPKVWVEVVSSGYRIIPWYAITAQDGTGIVHIAPGCDKTHFELGKRHSLTVLTPLDDKGHYLPDFAPWLDGLDMEAASAAVAERFAVLK